MELFSTIPSGTVMMQPLEAVDIVVKSSKRSDLNLIGLDQDPEAIKTAEIRLKSSVIGLF